MAPFAAWRRAEAPPGFEAPLVISLGVDLGGRGVVISSPIGMGVPCICLEAPRLDLCCSIAELWACGVACVYTLSRRICSAHKARAALAARLQRATSTAACATVARMRYGAYCATKRWCRCLIATPIAHLRSKHGMRRCLT